MSAIRETLMSAIIELGHTCECHYRTGNTVLSQNWDTLVSPIIEQGHTCECWYGLHLANQLVIFVGYIWS